MPYLTVDRQLPFSDPDTSRDAAVRAQAFAGSQRERVRAYVQSCGDAGATQIEASAALGISRQSMAARCHELAASRDLTKGPDARDGCKVYRVAP